MSMKLSSANSMVDGMVSWTIRSDLILGRPAEDIAKKEGGREGGRRGELESEAGRARLRFRLKLLARDGGIKLCPFPQERERETLFSLSRAKNKSNLAMKRNKADVNSSLALPDLVPFELSPASFSLKLVTKAAYVA